MADIDPSILAEFDGDEAKARRYLAVLARKQGGETPAPKPAAKPTTTPLARAARAPVKVAAEKPAPKVEVAPEPEPVADDSPRPGMDVVAPEIAKQKAAFDQAYARATEAYRTAHDPRWQAFEEHNAELARTLGPVARTALDRAMYVPRKVAEGVAAADAAYDALPAVREGRARFAAAEDRPARAAAPVRAVAPPKTPTIEVPVAAPTIKTPPSPGFTPTETFEVGAPTKTAKQRLIERGYPAAKVNAYSDEDAQIIAEDLGL